MIRRQRNSSGSNNGSISEFSDDEEREVSTHLCYGQWSRSKLLWNNNNWKKEQFLILIKPQKKLNWIEKFVSYFAPSKKKECCCVFFKKKEYCIKPQKMQDKLWSKTPRLHDFFFFFFFFFFFLWTKNKTTWLIFWIILFPFFLSLVTKLFFLLSHVIYNFRSWNRNRE